MADDTDNEVFVAYSPSQIKSATDNNGEFSAENDDIRFSISDSQIREYRDRINDWLSDENIKLVNDAIDAFNFNGMTKEQIRNQKREIVFSLFDNEPQPIGAIHPGYLPYFGEEMRDNVIYSGKAYFIDHCMNSHPEVEFSEYDKILFNMLSPDLVKLDKRHNETALIFIKRYDKYFAEVVKSGDGRLLLHKTCYYKDKVPQKGLPNVEPYKVSEGGESSIDPANAVTSTRLSVFDTEGKDTNSSENSNIGFRLSEMGDEAREAA